jgi:HTH-type transcriptional regulator, sugar sensing transcriptional regulator
MQEKMLKKLGMTEKEAMLYLKLLELGSSGANSLSKRINENRTSTYSLLQSMEKKGFLTFFLKKNVKYFVATDPSILVNHYLEGAKGLQALLPELLAIHNAHGQKPKITFYEGVSGIKQIGEITLSVPNSVRESFMGIDQKTIHPEIKKYYEEDFINRRIEKNITYRGIVTGYMATGKKHPKDAASQLRDIKYVDKDAFPINIHIDIFSHNKVSLFSYHKDEMMGVIIEHEAFYTTMRTAFKLAWAGVDTFK